MVGAAGVLDARTMRPLLVVGGWVARELRSRLCTDPPTADALVREVLERNPSVKARELRRDAPEAGRAAREFTPTPGLR